MASQTVQRPHFAEASVCFQCKKEFTTFRRRHHCRNCGNSFCGDCQEQRIAIPSLNYNDPERVCNPCFDKLSKKPLKGIRSKLLETAIALGLSAEADQAGNVLISAPASSGFENKPAICLQAHMDMVGAVTSGRTIDWTKETPIPKIEGDWLRAEYTSLGADNGIGIGIGLALLTDKSFRHPLLELLVTYDEEVGLVGARNLKEGWLKSKILINVDSEEENSVCIGCAGAFSSHMKFPIQHVEVDATKYSYVNVTISENVRKVPFLVKSFEGGIAHNAIPTEASAKIWVPNDQKDGFIKSLKDIFGKIKAEYTQKNNENKSVEDEKTLDIKIAEEKAESNQAMRKEDSSRITDALFLIPNGVLRMVPKEVPSAPDMIETSATCAVMLTTPTHVDVLISVRSSLDSQMDANYHKLVAIAHLHGGELSPKQDAFPGWDPDPSSALCKILEIQYEKVTGKKPDVYAIHAGLECGMIQSKYPGMDCASVGPRLNNPHTVKEELRISTVQPCYEVCKRAIEQFL